MAKQTWRLCCGKRKIELCLNFAGYFEHFKETQDCGYCTRVLLRNAAIDLLTYLVVIADDTEEMSNTDGVFQNTLREC